MTDNDKLANALRRIEFLEAQAREHKFLAALQKGERIRAQMTRIRRISHKRA